ncbi:copper resistance CopC family protein [Niallia endozanthoxylica]|uniref:CopC domain-containing protein n=1 Tax=Niallia endozanthoxylica TaxID=2036016 RepID=A0A5J5HZ61_9BACI|nr:copper resistance protein CopC [Niallia endozanthoxylica]KAA9028452.1 hypothetical protein F4V44_04040 [Niallia endozanthoxylica]
MLKKLSFLTLILFFLMFVQNAMAHTGLESSFPEDGAVIKEEIQTITLTFETKIEQGSTFELVNSSGESIVVENISLAEKQMTGSLSNPLEGGEYQVNWNIIGADGHPVDGAIAFTVDIPASEVPEEAGIEQAEETEEAETTEEAQSQSTIEEKNQEKQQNNSTSFYTPILLGIVIIIISFVWVMKRKK